MKINEIETRGISIETKVCFKIGNINKPVFIMRERKKSVIYITLRKKKISSKKIMSVS